MAEETKKTTTEEVVKSDVPVAAEPPHPEPEKVEKEAAAAAVVEEVVVAEGEKKEKDEEEASGGDAKITESASFKEESNKVDDLIDPEKKALDEFKLLIQEALNKREFTAPPPPPPAAVEAAEEEKKPQEVESPKPEEKIESCETPAEKIEEKIESLETPAVAPPRENTPAEKTEVKIESCETPAVVPPAKIETPAVAPPPEKTPAEKTEEKIESCESPAVAPAPEKTPAEKIESKIESVVEEIKETIVHEVPTTPAPPPPAPQIPPSPEQISIWGVPLLADSKTDTILLKFLRARDFKVKDAFAMLKNVVAWRKSFNIDDLIEQDSPILDGLDNVVFIHGLDKEGHPVCYNAFGEFEDKELYSNTFADEEKRERFLKWYIGFLEKSVRELDFSPDGSCTIVQVTDLRNSPGLILFKKELRLATNQALQLLQDNYPEFVAKQVFINVPWWYLAYNRMISPFLTQRTKSKFVFAGSTKTAETLFKYIAPEQVPVQYGGLSKEGEQEFTSADIAIEEIIKPTCKHTIELPITEPGTLFWEVRVVGWDISYGAEFVPSVEGGYTWIVQKSRKIGPSDEQVISCSFKIGETGKVVLTFDNQSSKKKKLLYRFKTKPSE